MFREAIRKAVTRELGHKVVGECGTGAEAVEHALRLRPEGILLDLSLPDFDGLTVVDRLHQAKFTPRILILSSHCDDYTLFRVERAGVDGFVDKNANTTAILGEALHAIEAGRCFYSTVFQEVRRARRDDPRAFTKVLTEWELEILSLIGLGLSDAEIGQRLQISPRTVQTHRSNLLRKLKVSGTPKLMRFAIEHGFTATSEQPRTLPKRA